MTEVSLETFSWERRREHSRRLNELATNPENKPHLDTHVPGLTERYATRHSAAGSIKRILKNEGKIADVILVDDKVVGVASFLLDKTVVHPDYPQQPVTGTHTWFWLDRETHEADQDLQDEVAKRVTQSAIRHNRYAEQLAASTVQGDTPHIAAVHYEVFTTLTGEQDPAWALTRTGFRQLGEPALLGTGILPDIDGMTIPDTEMVLAVLDTRTE